MKRRFEQLKAQLGWQALSGLLLLVLVWVLHIEVMQPLEQEADYLRNRLDLVQSKKGIRLGAMAGNRQTDLEQFFESLPAERDVTDILASIAAIAEASGIELKQAEYHLDANGKQVMKYSLYYPVQGGYANIRHFVFRVLAEHPALALDQIDFQRDKVNDPLLQAEIRLTVFLHRAD